jgi:hypothetical protein
MHIRQSLLTFLAATAWTAASVYAQSTSTSTTYTRDFNLPAVGVAPTETVQINLVNIATASSTGTAASCTGAASFFNASGAAIGTPSSFTVTSGEIQPISLPFSKVGTGTTRALVRGTVELTGSTTSPTPCALLISLETYDTTTGVTHVLLTNGGIGGFGFGGPPRPPF